MKALALGELVEDNIEYQKTDEIGDLVMSMAQLKNGFKETITPINAIAAGNYNSEVKALKDLSARKMVAVLLLYY